MLTEAMAEQSERPAGRMVFHPVSTAADLDALRPDWQDLWARCPNATPFQSPDWIVPWWRVFGDGRLLSWAVRRGGRLVAVSPFYIYAETGCRKLFLIGTGNSDYLDILCEPQHTGPVVDRLFGEFECRWELWDLCELHQLSPSAALLDVRLSDAWEGETLHQDDCPVLDLMKDPEKAGAEMRRRARYYRRRIEREGDFRTELARPDTFDEIFAALVRLHNARWKGRGGVLGDNRDQTFHREAAMCFLRSGVLRLHAARLDGRIIAVLYGLHAHRRTYFYLSGFDPEWARFSPGTLIVAEAIEQARRDGAIAFDFLRGEESYKFRWGAQTRANMMRRFWCAGSRHGRANRQLQSIA